MRKTTASEAKIAGTGLHKGRPSCVTFLPAKGPTGIRFFRPDLSGPIKASLDNIAATVRGTNITDGTRTIYTVEHILSACAGLGIDDLDIAMNGEEPPAADGSALPFVKLLAGAGRAEKPAQKREKLVLEQPVEYAFEKAVYRARPSEFPCFSVTFSHPHPLIGTQKFGITLTPEKYMKEVAPARTFGFKSELSQLKAAGLALGGSLENAVVIDDNAFLSAEGALRFPDEFVRHKLLDLLGDLALTGLALDKISVEAEHTGHKNNVNFAKMLMEKRRK
jgi:UDP-3-O-[3-hydroxymyristoyl] N-acetylglucosamine deacetylase